MKNFDLQQFGRKGTAEAAAQRTYERFAGEVVLLRGRADPAEATELREALIEPYVEEFEEATGFDGHALLEDYTHRGVRTRISGGGFRYSEVERGIREANAGRAMRTVETITSTQMAMTINLTTVHDIYDDYGDWPAVWRDLAEIVPSNAIDEVYPEEWSDDMPIAVAETEPAPEARITGNNIRIRNYEYARELVISKRLFDRDKLGRVRDAANRFGRKYIQAMDKAFVIAFFAAGSPGNLITRGGTIPAVNLAGMSGYAGFNPSGAGPITPARLEDALTAPALFLDPFNVEIVVEFDTVFVDSFDRMKTLRFLNSQYTSTLGLAPGADTTGQAPGTFAENVLRGMLQLAYSPYVKRSRNPLAGAGNGFPWAVIDGDDSGAVMQIVHELEVEQEAPNAGRSHEERSYRWQGVVEFGTGMRNARKVYFGN